jgi:hypothetical protein
MDVESSSSAPYYVPTNKSNSKIPIGQGRPQPMMNNFSGVMNPNISNNYSQMGLYQPQLQGRTFSDQHGYQNMRQPVQNLQNNKYPNNPNQNNSFQNNSFQNNSFQNHFQNNNNFRPQQQPLYNLP